MRRFLAVSCFAVLVFGAVAAHHPQAPTASVTAAAPGSPFPPVWSLSQAPSAVSAASMTAAGIRARDVDRWYATAAADAPVVYEIRGKNRVVSLPRKSDTPTTTAGNGTCGGDLPSCSIMRCESGGNTTAVNHNSIRPAGKWQITTGTWGGYGGYATADQAPEAVQDAKARELWRGGAGRGQWACR